MIRIMPLGDSITVGSSDPNPPLADRVGYRYDLQHLLTAAGVSFDMVGSQQNGPLTGEDRDHEGYLGYRIDQLDGIVAASLAANPADVILLLAGTNDIAAGASAATMSTRMTSLLATIKTAAPAALVLVSDPPLTAYGSPFDDERVAYAAALPGIIAAAYATNQLVSQIPTALSLPVSDINGHPSAAGYAILAGRWFTAITSFVGRAAVWS